MSSVRALDSNHDWTFGRGLSNYVRDQASVEQDLNTRLNSFLGDCFFDIAAGIDWFNLLGTKNTLGMDLALKTLILNTDSVTGLIELSFTIDNNRKLTATYTVSTTYTVLQGSLTQG